MIKTITDIKTLKTGNGAKGPWVLSKVTDSEGKSYTTFADFKPYLNQEADVIVEQNPNGRQGDMNIKLIERKSPEEKVLDEADLSGEILLELKGIRKVLESIRDKQI